jgi:hypothetical protein
MYYVARSALLRLKDFTGEETMVDTNGTNTLVKQRYGIAKPNNVTESFSGPTLGASTIEDSTQSFSEVHYSDESGV